VATAVAERKRQKVWLENRWWVLHQQMFKRLCAHDFDLLLSIILRQSTVCIHHHSSSTLASSTFVFVLVPSTLQHSLTVNSLHSSAFICIHLHSAIWTSVCLASPLPTPGNRSPTMVSRVLVEAPLTTACKILHICSGMPRSRRKIQSHPTNPSSKTG